MPLRRPAFGKAQQIGRCRLRPDRHSDRRRRRQIIKTHDILRLKGFAAVTGKPLRLTLQAVGPRVDSYFDRPFGTDPRTTRLVVIGQAGLDQAAITKALQA